MLLAQNDAEFPLLPDVAEIIWGAFGLLVFVLLVGAIVLTLRSARRERHRGDARLRRLEDRVDQLEQEQLPEG